MTLTNDSEHTKSVSGTHVQTVSDALSRATQYLESNYKHGFWPYIKGKGPSTEATAWCALALYAADNATTARSAALRYLLAHQNKDGGWSTSPVIKQSEWCTSPAVLALRIFARDEKDAQTVKSIEIALKRAYVYLFDMRTDLYRSAAKLFLLLFRGPEVLRYGRGWPWNQGCCHWVEPSAYALYALKIPGVPDYIGIQAAVNFANHFFDEHACADGGWNHGAHRTLNVNLPSNAVTTGEALVALQDQGQSPAVQAGIKRLTIPHSDDGTALALAWGILALDTHHANYDGKLALLLQKQKADGSFGPNNVSTAVASLALSTALGKNILKFGAKTLPDS